MNNEKDKKKSKKNLVNNFKSYIFAQFLKKQMRE